MKLIICTLLLLNMQTILIFDFNKESNLKKWTVINDAVMGGSPNSISRPYHVRGEQTSLRYWFLIHIH